jgi:serine/threonine-protein kinase RsbW/stage II sporulation protein AB (anti-sigma F factor)
MDSVRKTTQTLSRSYPALAETVPQARGTVVEFARAAGAGGDLLDAVRLAVSEAVTNAVVHAYRDDGGEVHVTAAVAGNELWVLIADDGHGLEGGSHHPGLGKGLALIATVSDDLWVVNRSGGGTELRMRFRLEGADDELSDDELEGQPRGLVTSAIRPASSRFSTTR